MSLDKYKRLPDGTLEVFDDVLEWARWYETADRHVADTYIGARRVSTVFLSIDHAFTGGPPVLWETMVFGGRYDCNMSRYTSEAWARDGHIVMVRLVQARTCKSGRRLTRTDHLRALRQSIARTVKHRDPAGFMLFLERCPLHFLSWMADTEAHRKIGKELEAKWAREAQAERGTDDQASP